MKKLTLPVNKLDIITPVLRQGLNLTSYAGAYPEFLEMVQSERGGEQHTMLYPITKKTPRSARKATEILGYYFRRKFGFDFPPYQADDHGDERDRIFLLTQERDWDTDYAVGVIAFRWRKNADAPGRLVLSWVGIHPFLRRQGILTTYWEGLRKCYGHFTVEPPLSKAMQAFLKKMDRP
jgi:hypothetical protein